MSRRVRALARVMVTWGACKKAQPPPPTGAGSGEGEAAAFVQTAHDALVGHPAPAVTLQLLDGSRVELASLLGKKPIYLKFWATWCVPSREQMPHLQATFDAHKNDLAVFAVDVAIDDPIENVRTFVANKKLTMPIAVDNDGSVSEQFHLNVTPQHVLLDRAGVIRYVGHAMTPTHDRALTTHITPD